MEGNSAARARVVLYQGKRKQKHASAANRKNPIGIDVGKCGSLGLKAGIDSGQSLPLRVGQAETRVVELLRQAIERVAELSAVWVDVVTECNLMKLGTSGNDRSHYRGANAGADVASEIYQTRDGVAFFALYADVRRRRSRYKHKT